MAPACLLNDQNGQHFVAEGHTCAHPPLAPPPHSKGQLASLQQHAGDSKDAEKQLQSELARFPELLKLCNIKLTADIQEQLGQLRERLSEEALDRAFMEQYFPAKKDFLEAWLQEQYQQLVADARDVRGDQDSRREEREDSQKNITHFMMQADKAEKHQLKMLCAQLHFNWQNDGAKLEKLRQLYAHQQRATASVHLTLQDLKDAFREATSSAQDYAERFRQQRNRANGLDRKLASTQGQLTSTQGQLASTQGQLDSMRGSMSELVATTAVLLTLLERLQATPPQEPAAHTVLPSTVPCSVSQPRVIVPGTWSSFSSHFKSQTAGMPARGQEPKAAAAPPQDQQYDLAKAKDCMAKAQELLLQVQDPQHEHHGWANLELIPLDEPCSPLYQPPGDAPPADPAEEEREVWLWLTSSMDGVDVEDLLGQPQQAGSVQADDELAPVAADLMQRLSLANAAVKTKEAEVASLKAQNELLRQQVAQQQTQLDAAWS